MPSRKGAQEARCEVRKCVSGEESQCGTVQVPKWPRGMFEGVHKVEDVHAREREKCGKKTDTRKQTPVHRQRERQLAEGQAWEKEAGVVADKAGGRAQAAWQACATPTNAVEKMFCHHNRQPSIPDVRGTFAVGVGGMGAGVGAGSLQPNLQPPCPNRRPAHAVNQAVLGSSFRMAAAPPRQTAARLCLSMRRTIHAPAWRDGTVAR